MTDTPWTPGPWRFEGHAVWGGPDEPPVLLAETHSGERPWISVNELADKRLIEAAPEMAELLERLVACVNQVEGDTADYEGIDLVADDAYPLLSRIRGETDA